MEKMTLRQVRRVQEITQEEMAKRLGVSKATYAAWEKCPAKVQTGKLIQAVRILGCKLTDIRIFGEGESKIPYTDCEEGD